MLLIASRTDGEGKARIWTSSAGTTIEAGVVSFDGNSVTLNRKEGGKPLTVNVNQLSAEDRAFLREYEKKASEVPRGEPSVDGIDAEPGRFSGPISCGGGEWSYHLCLPKDFHTGKKWPVWSVMSAGGRNSARTQQER